MSAVGPRAILRVPEVLMALAAHPEGIAFAGLGQRLSLPKSSLHRMLATLERGGYVSRVRGLYRLGPQSVRLAQAIANGAVYSDLPALARPYLEALAGETGESVMLGVLDASGENVCYIDVINSSAPLHVTVPQGNLRPLYSAAAGKVLLAQMPPDRRAEYLAKARFEQFTGQTTTREELAEVLKQAREEGFVFDRNGSFLGASALAAPCFDASGAVAALSVAGPTNRIEANLGFICNLVLQASEALSRKLGKPE